MKLNKEFYSRDTLIVAEELLGKILVREVNGKRIAGRIVETEAYMGPEDKAAHTYGGKRTQRVEPMFESYGRAYIYFVYGMYYCFNIVTREAGVPQAVLIRAVEPIEGLEIMSSLRFKKGYNELKKSQIINLTNGPAKLCNAFLIDKSLNRQELDGEILYVEEGNLENFEVEKDKRIGIDYAEEAKDYLWRFYIKGNPYVSKVKKQSSF